MRRRTLALLTAPTIVLALALAGCSSSSDGGSGVANTTEGSSYEIVSDAQVAAGLATVQSQLAEVVATLPTDQTGAQALVSQAYDTWYTFEGTIKEHSKNQYLDLEDALGSVKTGTDRNDQARVAQGAAAFDTAAAAYLSQWPGGAGGTEPGTATSSGTDP